MDKEDQNHPPNQTNPDMIIDDAATHNNDSPQYHP